MKVDQDIGLGTAPEGNSEILKMQREFDEAFSMPFKFEFTPYVDLLTFQLNDSFYAIRFSDLKCLSVKQKVTHFFGAPSNRCIGLCSIQGKLTPVFDLGQLMKYPANSVEKFQWFLLCGIEEPFALAITEIKGHVRISSEKISTSPTLLHPDRGTFLDGAFVHKTTTFSVIKLSTLLMEIEKGIKK